MRILRPVPVESLRLLVFDLDGTLIDSVADLAASINAMLDHYGRPELPLPVISSYIGDGASMLVRRALGDPDDDGFVHEALGFFLGYYRVHKLDHTYIYAGVLDALRTLQTSWPGEQAPAMAVLTNKPIVASRDICAALGLSQFFFNIYGGNSFHTKKPDPHGIDQLIEEAGVSPAQTLMIGDSDVDVLTARNAGAWALGCTFGLAPHTLESAPPDILVDSASEWPLALGIPQPVR